jgi:hypothetical protein
MEAVKIVRIVMLLLLYPVLLVQCSSSDQGHEMAFQEGDLLFQDLDCGPLCDAIEKVTEGVDGQDFSHCGMVVAVNESLMVVEAIGNQVQLNSLEVFLKRSGDTNHITRTRLGRLREPYQHLIAEASEYALSQLNEPYDNAFLLNNDHWYCSELLYESFKRANDGKDFFELEPMTYKDPESAEFFPAWIDYYAKLGIEIPEGEPGLNPGSISRSDKIELVYLERLP